MKTLTMSYRMRAEWHEAVDPNDATGVGRAIERATRHLACVPHVEPESIEFYWREEAVTNGCTPDYRG